MIGPWPLEGGEEGVPQAGVKLDVTNVGIPHTSQCLPEGHDSLEYPVLQVSLVSVVLHTLFGEDVVLRSGLKSFGEDEGPAYSRHRVIQVVWFKAPYDLRRGVQVAPIFCRFLRYPLKPSYPSPLSQGGEGGGVRGIGIRLSCLFLFISKFAESVL